MRSQLRFFTDFDVQKLEPTFMEIVYQTKIFRFAFPENANLRKFSVRALGKIQVTLPEVILEHEHDGQCDELHVVDLCAEFVDMGRFADFVAKLGNIGGYQQSIPPIFNASLPAEDDPCEDENDERDESEMDPSMHLHLPMLPLLSLFDDYTHYHVDPQYFQLTVAGTEFRFVHPPAQQREIRARRFKGDKLPGGLPALEGGKGANLMIPGVMLQGYHKRQNRWLDAFEVDLYMEFTTLELGGELSRELRTQVQYVVK